ncbi:hypothetical protein EDB85DRAFT_1888121 [Lactarius pseudohatsudake]|nr:hypothetical protein EDB85DRAFT_1888121 [Lactarius pseudohatsudake]
MNSCTKGISFVGLGLHDILTLAYWRNVLHGTDIEFPEYDYTTPLGEECMLPYMAMWIDNECRVLPFRGVRPWNLWAVYPIDMSTLFYSDGDTTLTDIDTSDSKSHSEAQVVLDDPQAVDRRQFDPNTQTKDADMTLAQNDLSDPKSCSEAQVALNNSKGPYAPVLRIVIIKCTTMRSMQAQYKCISQVGTSPKTPLTHVGGHMDGNTCLAGMLVPPLLWLASHGQFRSSIYTSDPLIETYAALFYAQPKEYKGPKYETCVLSGTNLSSWFSTQSEFLHKDSKLLSLHSDCLSVLPYSSPILSLESSVARCHTATVAAFHLKPWMPGWCPWGDDCCFIHDSKLEWAPAPDHGSSGWSTPSSTTLVGSNYKPLYNGTTTSAAEPGTAICSSSSQSVHCWGYIQCLCPRSGNNCKFIHPVDIVPLPRNGACGYLTQVCPLKRPEVDKLPVSQPCGRSTVTHRTAPPTGDEGPVPMVEAKHACHDHAAHPSLLPLPLPTPFTSKIMQEGRLMPLSSLHGTQRGVHEDMGHTAVYHPSPMSAPPTPFVQKGGTQCLPPPDPPFSPVHTTTFVQKGAGTHKGWCAHPGPFSVGDTSPAPHTLHFPPLRLHAHPQPLSSHVLPHLHMPGGEGGKVHLPNPQGHKRDGMHTTLPLIHYKHSSVLSMMRGSHFIWERTRHCGNGPQNVWVKVQWYHLGKDVVRKVQDLPTNMTTHGVPGLERLWTWTPKFLGKGPVVPLRKGWCEIGPRPGCIVL